MAWREGAFRERCIDAAHRLMTKDPQGTIPCSRPKRPQLKMHLGELPLGLASLENK